MKFNPEKLRELRLKHEHSLGTTCRLLKARAGYKVSRSAVLNWERGRFMPGIPALVAYCKVYGVEPGYFFEREVN